VPGSGGWLTVGGARPAGCRPPTPGSARPTSPGRSPWPSSSTRLASPAPCTSTTTSTGPSTSSRARRRSTAQTRCSASPRAASCSCRRGCRIGTRWAPMRPCVAWLWRPGTSSATPPPAGSPPRHVSCPVGNPRHGPRRRRRRPLPDRSPRPGPPPHRGRRRSHNAPEVHAP